MYRASIKSHNLPIPYGVTGDCYLMKGCGMYWKFLPDDLGLREITVLRSHVYFGEKDNEV